MMPILRFIETDMNRSFTQEVRVPDRRSARYVLEGDLRATAETKWADAVLAEFDSGKNEIVAQNGPQATFSVQYEENADEVLHPMR